MPLTTGGTTERFPVWSPDGASIAFVSAGPGGDRLVVVPAGADSARTARPGGGIRAERHLRGTTGWRASLAWSPDSRSIACLVRDGEAVPGELSVEGPRMAGDPAVATEITERLRGGPRVCSACSMSRAANVWNGHGRNDHSRIPVVAGWCGLYAVARAETETAGLSRFTLLRFTHDGAEPTVLTEFTGTAFAPALSPDGSGSPSALHAKRAMRRFPACSFSMRMARWNANSRPMI